VATRLYPQSSTPTLTPARSSEWEEPTTGATPTYRDALASGLSEYTFEALSQTETGSSNTNARDLHIITLVSPPLAGSGSIAGTLEGAARMWESNSLSNSVAQVIVRLLASDGTNERVLYAGTTQTVGTNEAASSASSNATNRRLPVGTAAVTLTEQSFIAGDRIVIEVGARLNNTSATNYSAGFWLGHAVGGTDVVLANGTDVTQKNPWLEFSQDLTFGSGAPSEITGSGASVAPLAVSAGAGTVADPAAITGAGASVGILPVSAGAGAVLVTGAGASLAPLAASAGSAGVLIAGAGASTGLLAASAGTAQAIAGGAGSSTLPSGVSVGTAVAPIAGAGASSLPLPASAGAGLVSEFLPEITGAGASTAPLAASGGAAAAIVGGTGASTLTLAASAGAGSVSVGGAGASTITLPLSSGTARVLIAGAGASHIPLSGSGGRLRVFGGGITPASRGYVVPVEDRGYVVPLEDRGYVVPSD
jgi:hypothetical protein